MLFILSLSVFAFSSTFIFGSEEVPICGTASGMNKNLKVFPVIFNGRHVMNIHFKYVGTEPENKLKKHSEDWRERRVDFYFWYFENLTNDTMEIYEARTSLGTVIEDQNGNMHKTPPKIFKRNELLKFWGKDRMIIKPYGKRVSEDDSIYCDTQSCTGTNLYKIKILETGDTFGCRIIKKGFLNH